MFPRLHLRAVHKCVQPAELCLDAHSSPLWIKKFPLIPGRVLTAHLGADCRVSCYVDVFWFGHICILVV